MQIIKFALGSVAFSCFFDDLLSAKVPEFLPFFEESTLMAMVVLHQVSLKPDTMFRSYIHIGEVQLQNKI